MKKYFFYLSLLCIVFFFFGLFFFYLKSENMPLTIFHDDLKKEVEISQNPVGIIEQNVMPLSRAVERVTQKAFGVYISPHNSPIQPEKFTGYHTASDFEILTGEEDVDVAVYAICDAELKYLGVVKGYGGVIILACSLNEESITVIYGHIDITKVDFKIGDMVSRGKKLSVLAPGYSIMSDGERKHLHLGIHRGQEIELRGYTTNIEELADWYDPMEILSQDIFLKK